MKIESLTSLNNNCTKFNLFMLSLCVGKILLCSLNFKVILTSKNGHIDQLNAFSVTLSPVPCNLYWLAHLICSLCCGE